ncbi:hypothetical protein MFM001_46610 [Mycobacterium sp. MFM001]|uniref:GAP family protein n=1 Tax=Mycobacterium sp. MFM001 TaxID=2049453 RepID=UPI000DA47862|nr:GAP family protein [Mycobacterium sp. MFM001]GBE68199.1 hypothetical protein MFM001_46610 [Mycobacterium sp. MFM001]
MWGSVLGLALLIALDPIRLGWTLLVISRPRPMQNLVAYWIGGLAVVLLVLLVPMTVLHHTRMFASLAHYLATSPIVSHIQLGMGVLALSIAALMTVCLLARQRQPAHLPTPGGNTSTLVLDRNTPTVNPPLLGRGQDAATEGGSAIRRLVGRARDAWENGSLWVAFVIGFACTPPPDNVLAVLTITVTSGGAIGTQISAAIAFAVGMHAITEIMLVSYLVMPTKTQAVLELLHGWALARRRQLLVAMFAVVGVILVVSGMR